MSVGPLNPALAPGPTFILVNLVDHAAQGLNILGKLLQLVQVLLFLRLAGACWAHDGAGVHCGTWCMRLALHESLGGVLRL